MARTKRQSQIVTEAARLFAEYGYNGVSIEDLGAALGISGPALYRHFASKDALLSEILVSVSQGLLDRGRACVAESSTAPEALTRLIDMHLDLSLTEPELIRVQDRDRASLNDIDAGKVRRLQRAYVELWVDQLVPFLTRDEARIRAQAAFGLLNSTPHLRGDTEAIGTTLRSMAMKALLA